MSLDEFAVDIAARSRHAREVGTIPSSWSTEQQLAVALILDTPEHLVLLGLTSAMAHAALLASMPTPPEDLDGWLADVRAAAGLTTKGFPVGLIAPALRRSPGTAARQRPGRPWLADPTAQWALAMTVASVLVPAAVFLLAGVGPVLLAVASPAGIGLIMGVVILLDRWRVPRKDIHTPVAIGGERDFRDACFRVEKLAAAGDWTQAHTGATAICTWLRSERHYGSRIRKTRLEAALVTWTAHCLEYDPRADLDLR
jgi:hypothetical protein